MLVLGVAFYALPSWDEVIWALIGVGSAAAVVAGVRRNRPRQKAPWLWVAAALLSFCAGDTIFNIISAVTADPNPFPSLADVFYVATYVLLAIGILRLYRRRAAGRDRSVTLDALIVTAALGLLWWILLIEPLLADPRLTMLERLISIGYPFGDVVLLMMVAKLITVVRPNPSVLLMAIGMVGILVSDILYCLAQLTSGYSFGSHIDVGWFVFYAAWGAAALHPSMAELTEPRVIRPRQLGIRHQVALTVMVLVPLGVLAFEAVNRGGTAYPLVVVLFVGVAVVLALVRLYGAINAHSRSLLRSRGIREANAALLSATDADGVAAALRLAVDRLLPPCTPHRVHVAMNDGSAQSLFAHKPTGGAWMAYTRTLPADLADRLGGFEITLICPIALGDRFSGDPYIGALLIAADERPLGYLQMSMELAASQAALALERIMLGAEITRRNSEQYFRTLVQNTTDVILVLEPDGDVIRYASPSARTVFGADRLAGERLSDLLDTPSHSLTRDLLALAGPSDGENPVANWTVVRQDGTVQVEVSCRDLRAEPTVGGLVLTLRDVTDQRRLQSELTHRALHDSLTGLANRVLFTDRIKQAIAAAQESGAVVGVLFLDLDDFKIVNDTFGHEYGDKLLYAVSKRLSGALRPQDTAARLGGDEFAALIGDAPDADTVDQIAERVIAALSDPFTIDERIVSGVASIGVATSVDDPDGQDLLRQADLALYVAKNDGKGQWRHYQPTLHTAMVRRLELRAALDEAITTGSLELEFQPIVGLRSGVTAGFEALVRWNHPQRGRLLPDQFIEVAEESGLIVPMGDWVLRNALAAAVGWRKAAGAGKQLPYVSVNVSALQFRSPGFVASVRSALGGVGLSADRLMLEITESLLLRDEDQIWDDLVELRRAGVRVAIDDFGTGYSSLSYLRHVPLDVLKIDRLFTNTIAWSGQQAALVDGIVKLAHTLGLEVIAEGIERGAERDLLSQFGCRYGQGFLFAPPLSPQGALDWLDREQAHPPAVGAARF
jgi:diguanylate cyclase (GGDEF)-like protein/PAS domain S-box-containing protein